MSEFIYIYQSVVNVKEIGKELAKSVNAEIEKQQVGAVVDKANVEIGKSWAQLAAGQQKQLITKVVEETSHDALSKSIQLIDANLSEQRKRSRNVVISGLKEKDDEEDDDLKSTVFNVFQTEVDKKDILSVKRLGKFDESKRDKPGGRYVLVTLRYEDDANWVTNNGKGFKVGNGIWINPDRTRAERDALAEKIKSKKTAETEETERAEGQEPKNTQGAGPKST